MLARQKRFRIEGPLPAGSALSAAIPTIPFASRETPDLDRIQAELGRMKAAIAVTKREVASMQRSEAGHAGVHRAACELDAVFDATERATTTILGAVEEIESAANMLRASSPDTRGNDFVDIILDRVVRLYETCNFQDITGQRIEKVVATLKFVENRLDALLASPDGIAPAPPAPEIVPGRPVLTGPPLAGDRQNSQSDIDCYFG